jgi:hypothetical protein
MTTAFLAGYLTKTAEEAPKVPTFDDRFDAVAAAETGGLKNPNVRTGYSKGKGSSAWGPWQVGKLLDDYKPENKKFYGSLSPAQADHLNRLHNQRTAMLRFGNEPQQPGYHPKWDYSDPKKPDRGTGYAVRNEEDKATHRQVIAAMMRDILSRSGFNPDTANMSQIARIWQGTNIPAAHRQGWMERANAFLRSRGFDR